MRQKVVPRANREAIAGFIRPPLQLGLVKPGTDFRHEVLVPKTFRKFQVLAPMRQKVVPKTRVNESEGIVCPQPPLGGAKMPRILFRLRDALGGIMEVRASRDWHKDPILLAQFRT